MSKLFLGMLLTVAGVATGAVASEKSWEETHGAAGSKLPALNTTANESLACREFVEAANRALDQMDGNVVFQWLQVQCGTLSPETLKEIDARYAPLLVDEETPYKLKVDGFHKYHQKLVLVRRETPGAPVIGELSMKLSAFAGVSPATQATPVIQPQESQSALREKFLKNIKNKCLNIESMNFAGEGLSDLPSFQDVRAIKDEQNYSSYWGCCTRRIKVDFSNNALQGVPSALGLFLRPVTDVIHLENNQIARIEVLEHTLTKFLQVREGCKPVGSLESLYIHLGGNPITQTYKTVQDLPLSQALRDRMQKLRVTLWF